MGRREETARRLYRSRAADLLRRFWVWGRALVVVVVLVIVLVGVNHSPGKQPNLGTRVTAPASVVEAVTSVPESVFRDRTAF